MVEIIGLLQYLGLAPDKVVPFFILGWLGFFYLGKKFKPLEKSIQSLNHCVIEIQTLLRRGKKLDFKQTIIPFATNMSPMVLKKEFKPFIEKSGLAKQIKEKLPQLIEWLKKQNPSTGIDAQDKIDELVLSGKIEDYFNLSKYKEYLYHHGKTSADGAAILTIYLYEFLIPKFFKK